MLFFFLKFHKLNCICIFQLVKKKKTKTNKKKRKESKKEELMFWKIVMRERTFAYNTNILCVTVIYFKLYIMYIYNLSLVILLCILILSPYHIIMRILSY